MTIHTVQTEKQPIDTSCLLFHRSKVTLPWQKQKGSNSSLHKNVPEKKEAVKLTSESFHHPLQLQHSQDSDSTESFNNLFSTFWRAQKISSGEINIMQELLNKEQCLSSYKPVLALLCPCRNNAYTWHFLVQIC